MTVYELYTDGGCEPNPGPCSASGICLDSTKRVVFAYSEYLGEGTNNIAELTAIHLGIRKAKERSIRHVRLYSDSELSVELCRGTKKTKKPHLLPLVEAIQTLAGDFERLEFEWIKAHNQHPYNEAADTLCSMMLQTVAGRGEKPKTEGFLLLNCPFGEKDMVKSMGARWNPEKKKWTVQDTPRNRETFEKWLTSSQPAHRESPTGSAWD